MVLIFSISSDGTTTEVMKWLDKQGVNTLRINGDDKKTRLISISLETDDIIIEVNGHEYNFNDYDTVWYRKSGLNLFVENLTKKAIKDISLNDNELEASIKKNLVNEFKTTINYIHYFLEKKKSIGSRFNSDLNKLIVLNKAKDLGLSIPITTILSTKEGVLKNLDKSKYGLITKAISDGIYTFSEFKSYYSYTEELTESFSNNLVQKKFFPSLVQEKINKKFELRIFYLEGVFYSMAIFSQNDEQTEVDYRKYNNIRPNRNVPYKLNQNVAKKLHDLMKSLNLTTGSIDMIVDKDDNFIFLEINPVGQFGMTSRPCNYYLEKKIAECLN
jgi:ATP-GRASP peptide maturase of grasp-with-spasm system